MNRETDGGAADGDLPVAAAPTHQTAANVIGRAHGNDIWFAAGITHSDLSLMPSDDGQHLLICCLDRMVATSMGCSVESFRFADGRHYTAEELLDCL